MNHQHTSMPIQSRTAQARRITRAARGFSLLELSLVIAIMGILMTIVAVNLVGGAADARKTSTVASMNTIKTGIDRYLAQNGSLPPGLDTLVQAQLINSGVADAWDRPFYYTPNPAGQTPRFQLISMGEDGVPQTADDLNIWDHSDP